MGRYLWLAVTALCGIFAVGCNEGKYQASEAADEKQPSVSVQEDDAPEYTIVFDGGSVGLSTDLESAKKVLGEPDSMDDSDEESRIHYWARDDFDIGVAYDQSGEALSWQMVIPISNPDNEKLAFVQVSGDRATRIVPGRTTVADLLLALGKPDDEFEEDAPVGLSLTQHYWMYKSGDTCLEVKANWDIGSRPDDEEAVIEWAFICDWDDRAGKRMIAYE
jgi:hypothetical protein